MKTFATRKKYILADWRASGLSVAQEHDLICVLIDLKSMLTKKNFSMIATRAKSFVIRKICFLTENNCF